MRGSVGLFFLCLTLFSAVAQLPVRGKIVNEKGQGIPYAGVSVIGTFDGASADSLGGFFFTTRSSIPIILVASHLNYISDTLQINRVEQLDKLRFVLRESNPIALDEVVVSVSSFGVGERQKQTILKALDIYTNPSGNGDLALGMRQIPGLQDVGDREGFFVRGGDAYETAVHIEGVRIRHFFGQSHPNAPARSRYPAGMFSGLSLATGGYGVESGGALSGVLRLRLSGQSSSLFSLGISPLFWSAGNGWLSPNRQCYVEQTLSYSNAAYVKWQLKPEQELVGANDGWGYTARMLYAPSERDEVKSLVLLNYDRLGSRYDVPESFESKAVYEGKDSYVFAMLHWSRQIASRRSLIVSSGYEYHRTLGQERIAAQSLWGRRAKDHNAQAHIRMQARRDRVSYQYGVDYYYRYYRWLNTEKPPIQYPEIAAYTELSVNPWRSAGITAGLRAEYVNGAVKRWVFLPRVDFTQKLWRGHSVTLDVGRYAAWDEQYIQLFGIFPDERNLSDQYNLTYEWRPRKTQVLRLQLYDKEYRRISRYSEGQLNNKGKGYARGLDFFWKAEGLIPNVEHRLSYSYADVRRTSLYSAQMEQPDFVARHTASVVFKYWCAPIASLFNLSATWRTGMSYHDPNLGGTAYMNARTPSNWNMSVSYNYPFKRGQWSGVLVLSAHNLFNSNPTYGFRFARLPVNGVYPSVRISSPYPQFYMISLFLNIGVDRRKEIMNTDLKLDN